MLTKPFYLSWIPAFAGMTKLVGMTLLLVTLLNCGGGGKGGVGGIIGGGASVTNLVLNMGEGALGSSFLSVLTTDASNVFPKESEFNLYDLKTGAQIPIQSIEILSNKITIQVADLDIQNIALAVLEAPSFKNQPLSVVFTLPQKDALLAPKVKEDIEKTVEDLLEEAMFTALVKDQSKAKDLSPDDIEALENMKDERSFLDLKKNVITIVQVLDQTAQKNITSPVEEFIQKGSVDEMTQIDAFQKEAVTKAIAEKLEILVTKVSQVVAQNKKRVDDQVNTIFKDIPHKTTSMSGEVEAFIGATFSEVSLWDGDTKIKTTSADQNGNFVFSNLSLIVPKGQSKILKIKAIVGEVILESPITIESGISLTKIEVNVATTAASQEARSDLNKAIKNIAPASLMAPPYPAQTLAKLQQQIAALQQQLSDLQKQVSQTTYTVPVGAKKVVQFTQSGAGGGNNTMVLVGGGKDDVKKFQDLLAWPGVFGNIQGGNSYRDPKTGETIVSVDGSNSSYFGALTRAAIKAYQEKNGIAAIAPQNGVVQKQGAYIAKVGTNGNINAVVQIMPVQVTSGNNVSVAVRGADEEYDITAYSSNEGSSITATDVTRTSNAITIAAGSLVLTKGSTSSSSQSVFESAGVDLLKFKFSDSSNAAKVNITNITMKINGVTYTGALHDQDNEDGAVATFSGLNLSVSVGESANVDIYGDITLGSGTNATTTENALMGSYGVSGEEVDEASEDGVIRMSLNVSATAAYDEIMGTTEFEVADVIISGESASDIDIDSVSLYEEDEETDDDDGARIDGNYFIDDNGKLKFSSDTFNLFDDAVKILALKIKNANYDIKIGEIKVARDVLSANAIPAVLTACTGVATDASNNAWTYCTTQDGNFGKLTLNAVLKWQEKNTPKVAAILGANLKASTFLLAQQTSNDVYAYSDTDEKAIKVGQNMTSAQSYGLLGAYVLKSNSNAVGISSLTITKVGTKEDGSENHIWDVTNIQHALNTRTAETVTFSNVNIQVPKGGSTSFYVMANVASGASDDEKIRIRHMKVDTSLLDTSQNTMTVDVGDLTVVHSDRPILENIVLGSNEHALGLFRIKASSNTEEVKVSEFNVRYNTDNPDDTLHDLYLVNSKTTNVIGKGQNSMTLGEEMDWAVSTNVDLSEDSTETLIFKGDVMAGDADADEDDFTIGMVWSDEDAAADTSMIAITAVSDIAKNETAIVRFKLSADIPIAQVVSNTQGITIGKFTVQDSSSEDDVVIKTLTFDKSKVGAQFKGLDPHIKFYDEHNNLIALTHGGSNDNDNMSPAHMVTFASPIIVSKGATKTITVKADFGSVLYGGSQPQSDTSPQFQFNVGNTMTVVKDGSLNLSVEGSQDGSWVIKRVDGTSPVNPDRTYYSATVESGFGEIKDFVSSTQSRIYDWHMGATLTDGSSLNVVSSGPSFMARAAQSGVSQVGRFSFSSAVDATVQLKNIKFYVEAPAPESLGSDTPMALHVKFIDAQDEGNTQSEDSIRLMLDPATDDVSREREEAVTVTGFQSLQSIVTNSNDFAITNLTLKSSSGNVVNYKVEGTGNSDDVYGTYQFKFNNPVTITVQKGTTKTIRVLGRVLNANMNQPEGILNFSVNGGGSSDSKSTSNMALNLKVYSQLPSFSLFFYGSGGTFLESRSLTQADRLSHETDVGYDEYSLSIPSTVYVVVVADDNQLNGIRAIAYVSSNENEISINDTSETLADILLDLGVIVGALRIQIPSSVEDSLTTRLSQDPDNVLNSDVMGYVNVLKRTVEGGTARPYLKNKLIEKYFNDDFIQNFIAAAKQNVEVGHALEAYTQNETGEALGMSPNNPRGAFEEPNAWVESVNIYHQVRGTALHDSLYESGRGPIVYNISPNVANIEIRFSNSSNLHFNQIGKEHIKLFKYGQGEVDFNLIINDYSRMGRLTFNGPLQKNSFYILEVDPGDSSSNIYHTVFKTCSFDPSASDFSGEGDLPRFWWSLDITEFKEALKSGWGMIPDLDDDTYYSSLDNSSAFRRKENRIMFSLTFPFSIDHYLYPIYGIGPRVGLPTPFSFMDTFVLDPQPQVSTEMFLNNFSYSLVTSIPVSRISDDVWQAKGISKDAMDQQDHLLIKAPVQFSGVQLYMWRQSYGLYDDVPPGVDPCLYGGNYSPVSASYAPLGVAAIVGSDLSKYQCYDDTDCHWQSSAGTPHPWSYDVVGPPSLEGDHLTIKMNYRGFKASPVLNRALEYTWSSCDHEITFTSDSLPEMTLALFKQELSPVDKGPLLFEGYDRARIRQDVSSSSTGLQTKNEILPKPSLFSFISKAYAQEDGTTPSELELIQQWLRLQSNDDPKRDIQLRFSSPQECQNGDTACSAVYPTEEEKILAYRLIDLQGHDSDYKRYKIQIGLWATENYEVVQSSAVPQDKKQIFQEIFPFEEDVNFLNNVSIYLDKNPIAWQAMQYAYSRFQYAHENQISISTGMLLAHYLQAYSYYSLDIPERNQLGQFFYKLHTQLNEAADELPNNSAGWLVYTHIKFMDMFLVYPLKNITSPQVWVDEMRKSYRNPDLTEGEREFQGFMNAVDMVGTVAYFIPPAQAVSRTGRSTLNLARRGILRNQGVQVLENSNTNVRAVASIKDLPARPISVIAQESASGARTIEAQTEELLQAAMRVPSTSINLRLSSWEKVKNFTKIGSARLKHLLRLNSLSYPANARPYVQEMLLRKQATRGLVDPMENMGGSMYGWFFGKRLDIYGEFLPEKLLVNTFLNDQKGLVIKNILDDILYLEFEVNLGQAPITNLRALILELENLYPAISLDMSELNSLITNRNWQALYQKLMEVNILSKETRLGYLAEFCGHMHEADHYMRTALDLRPYLRTLLAESSVGEVKMQEIEYLIETIVSTGNYNDAAKVMATIVKFKTGKIMNPTELTSNLTLAWEKSALQATKELLFHLSDHPLFSDLISVSGDRVGLRSNIGSTLVNSKAGSVISFAGEADNLIDDYLRAQYGVTQVSASLPYKGGVANVHRIEHMTEEVIRNAMGQ